MVAFAFYPYENEDLYSWVVRYHFYSMNDLESQTKKDLFENGYFDFKLHYPSRINILSSNLQALENFSVEEILMNYTYINITKPFYTKERYENAKYGLLESDRGVLRNHGFHMNNLFLNDKNTIKICPICYEEDIKAVGEPYLHRPHNVIGVRTCYKHGCYLDTVVAVGTFKCSECGYTYSRKMDADRNKVGRVKDFGVLWHRELEKIIGDDTLSLRAKARHMGCDPGTIKKYI
ncbi:MAG: TniQ family protein [Clostridia bacterium]|nr:TniQ family protein [Clostridia bacterium]